MPIRPWSRDQHWALPPSLDDWVAADHPVRFVAAFVDALTDADWAELGIDPAGDPRGAPAYAPAALLAVWVYGFMTGVRSARALEAACRDQLPYLWLTGRQTPDHNTLWRFYQAHRDGLRGLLKRTVRVAVAAGLVDLAVQAVDGTKVAANAAKARTLDAVGLARLLERTDRAIADLEARHAGGSDPPPRLPAALARAEALRERVRTALAAVGAPGGPARANLTDGDAGLVKGRGGVIAGYNAQAVVVAVPLADAAAPDVPAGRLIVAADVTTDAHDQDQLGPMLDQAAATTGRAAGASLADGGYHSGANLSACAAAGRTVAMPDAQPGAPAAPYHKERFAYDPAADAYTCPEGRALPFAGLKRRPDRPVMRVYRAGGAACRACPAFGACTTDGRQGRALEVGEHEAALRAHRAWMATEEAQALYRRRQGLVEPVFGVLKERQGGRRFLLRGLAAVRAEWNLLAAATNLRTLWRAWRLRPAALTGALAG